MQREANEWTAFETGFKLLYYRYQPAV